MIKLIKSTFYKEFLTKLKLCWFIFWAKQLSFGKKCEEFEKKFSKWQGRREAVFVNSGSSANLALIQVLLNLGRLKKGDKVGFSALGWATTVMPLLELGLEPVAIDIDLKTLNVPSTNIPNDIKALFITNLLGFSGDMDTIARYCELNDIILLEDNCESLGSTYGGKKLGNFGLASTFSFYVGHHMSTIEGGMVATDDEELAQELRIVRAHGWDRNLDVRSQEKIRRKHKLTPFYSRYTFYSNGYNLRPTEIQGFLGCTQIEYLDEIIKKRERNFRYITGIPSRRTVVNGYADVDSNFAIPVLCKSPEARDKLISEIADKVEVRPIVGGNLTQQPFYPVKADCPNARTVHECGFYIGNNPDLTPKELNILKGIYERTN